MVFNLVLTRSNLVCEGSFSWLHIPMFSGWNKYKSYNPKYHGFKIFPQ